MNGETVSKMEETRESRWLWPILVIGWGAVLFFWHGWLRSGSGISSSVLQTSYAAGYGLLTALLIGLLARLRVTAYPAFWRMLAVMVGAVASAADAAFHAHGKGYFPAMWAPALVGVSAVAIAAKYLPKGVLKWWLGEKGIL